MPAASPMRSAADRVPCRRCDGELVPDWLSDADQPWLRELLLDCEAFVGRPFAALRARWRCSTPPPRAGARWPLVLAVLERLLLPRHAPPAAAAPLAMASQWRAQLFVAAAAGASREAALARVAAATGAAPATLLAGLFADLGDQRPVQWPAGLSPTRLQLLGNAWFARTLLATASSAELELHGASRLVLRTAWLQGAHFRCRGSGPDGARLQWHAGPGDRRAGTRLAAVLAVLPWARRFVLRAACRWRGAAATLVLTSLDALPPGSPPAPFDSQLEADLAAALVRALPEWEVLREPAPLQCGEALAFPDFGLLPRGANPRGARWWLELAGLRDPTQLAGKLRLLQQEPRYLLALPRRWCVPELVSHPRVVGFGRRVAATVLAAAVAARLGVVQLR